MALTDLESQALDGIEAGFIRTARFGLLRPWRGTFWHALLRIRAVSPLLALLAGCSGVIVTSALVLPAGAAAPLGAACGAFAVHVGRTCTRRRRPLRR